MTRTKHKISSNILCCKEFVDSEILEIEKIRIHAQTNGGYPYQKIVPTWEKITALAKKIEIISAEILRLVPNNARGNRALVKM